MPWSLSPTPPLAFLETLRPVDLILSAPVSIPKDLLPRLLEASRQALSKKGTLVLLLPPPQGRAVMIQAERIGWEGYELIAPLNPAQAVPTLGRPPSTHAVVVVLPKTLLLSVFHPLVVDPAGRVHVKGSHLPIGWHTLGTVLPPPYYSEETLALQRSTTYPMPPIPTLEVLVQMYSNPGSWVADPLAEGGAVGVAALLQGRSFVGAESDLRRFQAARKLLSQAAPEGESRG